MVDDHGDSADLVVGRFPEAEYMPYPISPLHKNEILVLLRHVFALIVSVGRIGFLFRPKLVEEVLIS